MKEPTKRQREALERVASRRRELDEAELEVERKRKALNRAIVSAAKAEVNRTTIIEIADYSRRHVYNLLGEAGVLGGQPGGR